jgi:hypothetical protein
VVISLCIPTLVQTTLAGAQCKLTAAVLYTCRLWCWLGDVTTMS